MNTKPVTEVEKQQALRIIEGMQQRYAALSPEDREALSYIMAILALTVALSMKSPLMIPEEHMVSKLSMATAAIASLSRGASDFQLAIDQGPIAMFTEVLERFQRKTYQSTAN